MQYELIEKHMMQVLTAMSHLVFLDHLRSLKTEFDEKFGRMAALNAITCLFEAYI
jgi:hypothetical protein